MGGGHGHGDAPALRIGRRARTLVLGLIALCALLALVGVVQGLPDQQRVDRVTGLIPFAAPGFRLVHGELTETPPACTGAERKQGAACGSTAVRIVDGANAGRTVGLPLTPDITGTGLRRGDRVLVFDGSAAAGAGAAVTSSDFSFYRADRGSSLLWLAVLFAVAVVAVALRRGLMALIGLGFAGLVVAGFLIPALLSGRPAIPVTLSAATLILIVLLYLTHGFSMRTSVALLGALAGVALSALLSWIGVVGTRLGGLGDESAGLLTFNVPWLGVQQLIVASVILAGIGTLNDVTVTQASALWELRGASPAMPRRELFRRAMRIGRDHVASTVYTLVFAYLGTALVLIVAIRLSGAGPDDFATSDAVAEEIVRALVGGVALVLAMPITTAIGALIVGSAGAAAPARPHPPVPARTPVAARPRERRRSSFLEHLPDDPWREG